MFWRFRKSRNLTLSKLEANFLHPTEWLILWQSQDPLKLPYHHPAIAEMVTPITNQQKLGQLVIPCMLHRYRAD